MTTTRRPPSYLTSLIARPTTPSPSSGSACSRCAKARRKGVAISRQERLAGRDHGGMLAIGKRKRLGHGILP
jgi:hypothetical protein